MRFSLTTGAAGEHDAATLARRAAEAELAGWDGFFLEDYLIYQGRAGVPTYDVWTCLAAMATATSTLRLGLTVLPLPLRIPAQVAVQARTLDDLSGGRLVLGVGAGDVDGGGADGVRDRAARLDDGLAEIDALMSPRRVPVWIGGDLLRPGVRRRLARWDGSCAYKGATDADHPEITPSDIVHLLAEVTAVKGTSSGYDVKVGGLDEPGRLSDLAAAGATWAGRWVDPEQPDVLRAAIDGGPPRL